MEKLLEEVLPGRDGGDKTTAASTVWCTYSSLQYIPNGCISYGLHIIYNPKLCQDILYDCT